MALLAALAALVGRGIAPALPGSRAGLDRWILGSDLLAALLVQPVALGGTLLATVLLYAALRNPDLGIFFRLVIVPAGAAATTLILRTATLQGSEQRLTAPMLLSLGLVTGIVLWAASIFAMRRPTTRAAGILLGASSMAALAAVLARRLALPVTAEASGLQGAMFLSSWVATAAFVCEVACVAAVWAWLWPARSKTTLLIAALIWGLGLSAALLVHFSASLEGFWPVLLARSLLEPLRDPGPVIATDVRVLMEVVTFATAVAAVLWKSRNQWLGTAAGLILLSVGAPDVPLLALCSLLGALLIALIASKETLVLPAKLDLERGSHRDTPQDSVSN